MHVKVVDKIREQKVKLTHAFFLSMFQVNCIEKCCYTFMEIFLVLTDLVSQIPTYNFAHAKVEKMIFYSKILEFEGDIGIILNDFQK